MRPHDLSSGTTPLAHLALLRFTGPDAASFLQGQLTCDTRLLADGRTQFGACTSSQGRVIALLRLRQTEGAVLALLPLELVEDVARHLRRYVLRAKVAIESAADLRLYALHRASAASMAEGVAFDYADGRRLVAMPRAAPPPAGSAVYPQSPADVDRDWRAADIAAGLPQVVAATSQAFVPQMLNLDLLDAISFGKGCYTGQEIVARTQHLGRIKRRTLRYRLAPGPEPVPLAGLHRDGVKVAEVLQAATVRDGVELLAVTARESRGATLEADDGRVATPLELPYAVPDGG